MYRVAVTGASGFVGKFFTQFLLDRNVDVVALTRSTPIEIAPNRFAVNVDYRNTSELVQVLRSCDVVVHLAALAHHFPSRSSSNSIDVYRHANLDCMVSVARASKLANVSRFVYVSSIGVNGSFTSGTAFTEADVPSPQDFYSITKLEAEQALVAELKDTETDWVVLRPPLVYGSSCPGNLKKLLRIAYILPILPFKSLHSKRTLISVFNLSEALFISCYHHNVSRRVFVISDSNDIDFSGILKAFLLGFGRGQWRLFPFPPLLFELFFNLLGKKGLWKKFSGELLVDSAEFCKATGWVPVAQPYPALSIVAADFSK